MAKGSQPLIPQPPKKPLLGNITDVDPNNVTYSLIHLAEKYGPIYKLKFPQNDLVVLSSWEGVNEACDDERFEKSIEGELDELRAAVGDGLFTSRGESEENWGIAHRVLVSAFGPLSIRAMFNEMHEVASQLALKWSRQGAGTRLDISEDFTRLTLDTVALCSMGFRFNSYYSETLHPFIRAMAEVLTEAGKKVQRPFPKSLYRSANKKFRSNIDLMRSTARQVMDARKLNKDDPRPRKDLLSAMLNGVDAKTGKSMSDESIIDNLITFLVAGHETTAGTLSFMMYNLLKHPDTYRKAQKEVDEVIGTGAIKLEHIPKLKYINVAIRETLRLSAPITAFIRQAKEDTTILGKYSITKDDQLLCFLSMSHRDPAVYGPTADDFDPERMLDENFDRLSREYPHSWKPFGTGMRACIGRPFAWQEMVLAWAVMLQSFDFEMEDPSYKLTLQETLTIRPKGFYVKAKPRGGLTPIELEARLAGSFVESTVQDTVVPTAASEETKNGRMLAIFYGSNSGTCEYMAHKLASDATMHGYDPVIKPLDSAKDALPRDTPVVILTASYEGQPPQNAAKFVKWMESTEASGLEGVSYSVWGCGHADWVKTYQRIPKLVDNKLHEHGASRMTPFACTDAKDRDMFSDFDVWAQQTLWPAIKSKFGGTKEIDENASSLKVSFSTPRISSLHQDVKEALVTEALCLTRDNSFGEKRHLEIKLPTGMTYVTGDYLAILPLNPREVVNRTLRLFNLPWDAHIFIQTTGHTSLPVDMSISVSDVLSSYVELSTTATRRNITALARHATEPKLSEELSALASDESYDSRVRAKKVSVLDILERHPSLKLPFEQFLTLLPPMRARQYSISSSPLVSPGVATLTYSVLNEPAFSGHGQYIGVATSYLACLRPGDKVQVAVRPANGGFRLPDSQDPAPCIFIGAGTGLAPLRAFVQERAKRGENASQALLFFGCRSPEVDDLYREEFDRWETQGAVKVFRAFSWRPEMSGGSKYVQHMLQGEREVVAKAWSQGAKIFVCGSSKLADEVKNTLVQIIVDQQADMTKEAAEKWFEEQRNERYAVDVFD